MEGGIGILNQIITYLFLQAEGEDTKGNKSATQVLQTFPFPTIFLSSNKQSYS